MNGWIGVNKIKTPVQICTKIEVYDDNDIKLKLIHSIATELYNKKFITVTKSYIPHKLLYEYTANMFVTDNKNKVVTKDKFFLVNDEEFSEEELIFAIKNTYPERLI